MEPELQYALRQLVKWGHLSAEDARMLRQSNLNPLEFSKNSISDATVPRLYRWRSPPQLQFPAKTGSIFENTIYDASFWLMRFRYRDLSDGAYAANPGAYPEILSYDPKKTLSLVSVIAEKAARMATVHRYLADSVGQDPSSRDVESNPNHFVLCSNSSGECRAVPIEAIYFAANPRRKIPWTLIGWILFALVCAIASLPTKKH